MLLLNNKEIFPTMFPDGTSQIWKLPLEEENHVVFAFEHEAEIVHLMQLGFLLRTEGFYNYLQMPYLPYARQDKRVSNESSFALTPFIKMMNLRYMWRKVEIFDPHSKTANLIHNMVIVEPHFSIASGYDFVVLPDGGAYKRYAAGLQKFNQNTIAAKKVREQSTGMIKSLKVEVPASGRGLVFDDLCDGGATFNMLAEKIRERSSASLDLYVSHGIFSKGLGELLKHYDKIYTTDSYMYPTFYRQSIDDDAKQSPRWAQIKRAINEQQLIINHIPF